MANKENHKQPKQNQPMQLQQTTYGECKKSTITLVEAKKKAREKNMRNAANKTEQNEILVDDIYQNVLNSIHLKRGKTGIVIDERMAEHCCLWDRGYPECPERFTRVIERCSELELIDRCYRIDSRPGTLDEILLKHTRKQFDFLKATDGVRNEDKLEDLSSHYDAIYIHPTTFQLAVLAVGSTIELVDSILANNVQNGMAIIRPPGHHAMKAEYNGYCFFNNVAIAAQYALNNRGVQRILIVDFDVHHGQATQQMFYNDSRVLYFSTHRYEYGTFWPNLRESDFDFIGNGKGEGFNFNVPLNKIGMTNADYLAIWQQILIPVANEYQPDLIIVSAGYDAAYGCPEGEMELTPACYAHLVSPLMALAQGRIAVVLEGGYCLDSLAEGAAITLKTLLNDPCPLMESLMEPCDSVQDSILNCIQSHKAFWKCLQIHKEYDSEELNNINPQPDLHKVVQTFIGSDTPITDRFSTRDCYPLQDDGTLKKVAKRLHNLRINTNLMSAPDRVCYVYDVQMIEHRNDYEEHYERPERITKIMERFIEYDLKDRMHKLASREAVVEELALGHSWEHINFIRKTSSNRTKNNLREMGDKFDSIYLHPMTYKCARLAVGSTLQVVENVLNGAFQNGVCVVRPPGHHAGSDSPQGFCIFNNVAVAAQYAIKYYGLKRILIVDWDIHHGNGTQQIFKSNSKVLYVSLHRYDHGNFFPKTNDGNYTMIGEGRGKGFNVNIPWNKEKMSDSEYIAAFQRIIMPIAYEFNPELVLVSAGFDAVVGDPIGHYNVTPEAYGHFTLWLSALANGKIILCLEGGYNINSISHAMAMCTKALLGDPLPILQNAGKKLNTSCIETIQNVHSVHRSNWKSLKFNKKLPSFAGIRDNNGTINELIQKMSVLECCDGGESKSSSGRGSNNTDPQPGSSNENACGANDDGKKQTLSDYLTEHRDALLNEEMFAVVPLSDCPHLSTLDPNATPDALNTKSACQVCYSTIENWICLICFSTCCGRYIEEHMQFHHLDTDHALALSFSDLSVWCYKCESYIDNPILFKYKNLAHRHKFGEEMVWCYSDIILMDGETSSPTSATSYSSSSPYVKKT